MSDGFVNIASDEEFDSEDLDDELLDNLGDMSAAVKMKLQGKTNLQRAKTTRAPKFEDNAHQAVYNQELAYLQEQIYESGYRAQDETLQQATA